MEELKGDEFDKACEFIESLRDSSYHSLYFSIDSYDKPFRIWKSGEHYFSLFEIEGLYFLGVLNGSAKKSVLFPYYSLLRKLAREYGTIFQWCYKENKKSLRIFDYLVEKGKAIMLKTENVYFIYSSVEDF